MKKHILIVFFIALSAIKIEAQVASPTGNSSYYPFSGFNNDTLSYLKLNFDTNKQFYIGKPVKVFLQDLETPIYCFISNEKLFNGGGVDGIGLLYRKFADIIRANGTVKKTPSIVIKFTQEVTKTEYQVYKQKVDQAYGSKTITRDTEWSTFGQYFYGERIIKDIKVVYN